MTKTFLRGLSTGFILQLAIGPIFFFIVHLTFQKTLLDGLIAVLAVTIVDYAYITLSIIGIGKLLEKDNLKRILGLLSTFILIVFGLFIILNSFNDINSSYPNSANLSTSFISAFLLTISNPLTIIFWTSIFTSKSIEYSLSKKELIIFGLAAGFATSLFLSISILAISIFKTSIHPLMISIGNLTVGLVLIIYGITRIIKNSSQSH